MIRVVIIDPAQEDRVHSKGLLSFQQDFNVVGMGKDDYDALRLVGEEHPDVVVMDINLEQKGIDIIRLLQSKSPDTAMVLFTTREEPSQICLAIKYGIAGYLLKDTDAADLGKAVKAVHSGGLFISSRITQKTYTILSDIICRQEAPPLCGDITIPPTTDPSSLFHLSRVEFQVIQYIAGDHSTRETAEAFGLSVGTIRNYVSTAMQKLGVENRVQLIRYVLTSGLNPPTVCSSVDPDAGAD